MRKLAILLFAILNILTLSGCNLSESNIGDKINTPDNNNIPIIGKWELNECIYGEEDKNQEDLYLDEKGFFHKDAVVIGQDYVIKPNFKFKKVNTDDYLLYKYKIESEDLNLKNKEIEIISVSNDNQHFYEFIKINKNNLIVHINEKFYSMKKIDDHIDEDEIAKHIDDDKSMFRTFDDKKIDKSQTGILLGIKYPTYDEKNDTPQWNYKTIWINSKDRDIVSIYELDSLLLPRKNGFWSIDVERETDGESIIDNINLDSKLVSEDNSKKGNIKNEEKDIDKLENKKLQSILKNILFVGNDYISVENINLDLGAKRTLKIYTLDNLKDERPIKLSDIIGEEGEDIFNDGAENLLSLDSATFNESNMGLSRKKGYWIFKGRVNYKKNNEELYKDFDIKAIPPKEMVSYDELSIPWNRIKMRIPQATDAFSSPNEDIIIVETRSALSIYPTSDGKISERSAIKRIDMPSQSSIIMSEWATGSYADIWEEEFIKNGGKSIIEE